MVYRRSGTWFTHLGGLSEIDVGQVVGHEVQGPAAVGGRRAEGDQLAPQALGDPQATATGAPDSLMALRSSWFSTPRITWHCRAR